MLFGYHYSAAEIAAALRAVAARLDALPEDTDLPETYVSLEVQISERDGDNAAARIAAVDALVSVLLPDSPATTHEDGPDRWTHRVPYTADRNIAGLNVQVYAPDVSAPNSAALTPAV